MRALLIAGFLVWLTGCAPVEPLSLKPGSARALNPGEWGQGSVIAVAVDLENKGDDAIHVFYNALHVVGADGQRASLRAFREQVRKLEAELPAPAERVAALKPLERVGVDTAVLEDIKRDSVEIPAGGKVKKVFAFVLSQAPGRLTLDVMYHDAATDKMFRASAPVEVR